jgi:hypothetical protein
MLACLIAVGLALKYLLTSTVSVRAEGRDVYVVSEFEDGQPIGQTFRARSDGLQAAELAFFADEPATVTFAWRLLSWDPSSATHWAPWSEERTTVSLPRGSSWQRFEFMPVLESDAKIYQLQVQRLGARPDPSTPAVPRPRVGPLASKDDALPRDGNLIIGDRQVIDQDMVFAAYGADSPFEWFRLHGGSQLPRWLQGRPIQFTLLALYAALLATFGYYLVIVGPERGTL